MSNKIICQTISVLLSVGISGTNFAITPQSQAPQNTPPQEPSHQLGNIKGMERCYGIAKVGRNECGNNHHGCAGESKIDGDKEEWILVPTGLCNKIVGGSTK